MPNENRSCPEFKARQPDLIVNCPNCKRFNLSTRRCREEIWLVAWIEWCINHG